MPMVNGVLVGTDNTLPGESWVYREGECFCPRCAARLDDMTVNEAPAFDCPSCGWCYRD